MIRATRSCCRRSSVGIPVVPAGIGGRGGDTWKTLYVDPAVNGDLLRIREDDWLVVLGLTAL